MSTRAPRPPVFRALAGALAALDVEHVFGVMGEDTAALTVAVVEQGIAYHAARHEAVAVGMADGYAWASKRPGVCMVTRGPGLMTAATACRSAVQGRRQVLLITGDVPTGTDRRFDYKFIEQAPIATALGMPYFAGPNPSAPAPLRVLIDCRIRRDLTVPRLRWDHDLHTLGAPAGAR